MYKIIPYLLLLISSSASAHVRWFVDSADIPQVSFPADMLSAIIVFSAFAFFVFCYYVHRAGRSNKTLAMLLHTPIGIKQQLQWYVLVVLFALMVMLCLLKGEFLAPNLLLAPNLMMLGAIVQVLAVLLLTVSVFTTGVVLVILAFALPFLFSFMTSLDYFFEFLFIGLSFMAVSPKINTLDKRYFSGFLSKGMQASPALILRIGIGLQLISLALRNKMFEPGAAMLFLESYPFYNFFSYLGWQDFTHIHFVLFIGVFEFILGLLLVTGFAVRIVIGVLAVAFLITAIVSGIDELIGHLPIFAIALIVFLQPHEKQNRPLNHF